MDTINIINPYQDLTQNDLIKKLFEAAKEDNTAQIELLIEAGVNVNAMNPYEGNTALIYACERGNTQTVELLITKGRADINDIDSQGWTALMVAIENGHFTTAALLITKGAALDMKNRQGNTAAHIAVLRDNEKILSLLIEQGANINLVNKVYGWTPLIGAVSSGKTAIAELLIIKKADLSIKGTLCGRTALDLSPDICQDIIFHLLSAMTPKQMEEELKLKNDSRLRIRIALFNQVILENRQKLFSIFGAYIIKGDTESFLKGQEIKMMASQLSQSFPIWYLPKIEDDLHLVFEICKKMKEKREAEVKEKAALFAQLPFASSQKYSEIIKALGDQYTFQNCATHLGYITALQIFSNATPALVFSKVSAVLNKAATFLPCFSAHNSDVEMKKEGVNNKRKRADNEVEFVLEENQPFKKRRKIGSSSSSQAD